MAVLVQQKPFIGSSSVILQPMYLSIGYLVYFNTTHHIEKYSWQNMNLCGFQSHKAMHSNSIALCRPVSDTRLRL